MAGPISKPGDDPRDAAPAGAGPLRRIIHVDMDAFFASVEQRDDPSLRGRPVVVGGSSRRGVVAAASYEARAFGVRSAMPSVTAARKCPELVFVKARFEAYKAVSAQIRAIFARYTDLIEPLSLDEAYLDVTGDPAGTGSATETARRIRAAIRAETGLTASAGVSFNKFLAKLASDQNKPDGLCVIRPAQADAFVAGLPVARFHGVGPRTAEKMARLGIATGADLRACDLAFLTAQFGSFGRYLYGAARGIDERPVRAHRERKSLGGERTFGEDLSDEAALRAALDGIATIVWERIAAAGARGRTLTLKVKYADFRIVSRAASLPRAIEEEGVFRDMAQGLLGQLLPVPMGVRLLGLTLGGMVRHVPREERRAAEAQAELPI